MRNQGIGSWPARRARKTPGRVAVVHEGRRVTYRELHERVLRLAHALRDLGVRRGDRIAYLGPNHPSFLETLFAAGALGAVFVPLNTRLAVPELAFNLTDSGAGVLVHAPSESAAALDVRHRVPLDDYERLISRAGDEPIDEPVSPGDPCMIMYTSGTTGRPKGAVLSHANITWNSVNVLVDIDVLTDEATLVVAPLFHTAGLNMTCLPTVLKGGRVVLLGAFDPGRVLELIETERITQMFGVPTMFDAMAAHPRWAGTDLSSLRTLNCGGAPVPLRTIETYLERGLAFSQGYGMTEASPGVLYLPAEQAVAKAGSAGVPHFFTDARVVRQDGRDTAPGEEGEILVQGPNVMTGYWGAQPIAPGEWLRTGDVARLDEDGYAYIVDRIKDMFVSGGENVYPAEVEQAILEHPAVAECAVIGVPDAVWGEVGRAVVVLRPGAGDIADDILDFLRGRLAKYKIPKSVIRAETLPRTPSGKIVKSALRDSPAAPASGA
ncbi:fatty-acyl-CoA synthase [Planobispora rosea]|uniref:Fatty-acyl-CoA synthase n=1 Tax=Planobispora rosea TaxID=35762 RepID=A0A8J3WF26_PLARO|nr:long-chain fatty acid--CoA ligase [Planobispora rosea]GGS71826.1 fatty-acyl-CoA synthase [Planobispora rosea]GIH85531.1 fatty-acyl-CoA synthase [Planobispora rosea]